MANHWDFKAKQMQQELFNNLGNATWNLYRHRTGDRIDITDILTDMLQNGLRLFTRLNGNPVEEQKILDMCQEINQNRLNNDWRRENFRDHLSNFVNRHKVAHHDNSVSLNEIHSMVGTYCADDDLTSLRSHLYRAITNTEPPNEFPERFLDIANELSSKIVEYQFGTQNNFDVSLVFVVIQIEIDGYLFAVPEPVFRVRVGPEIDVFVDRCSRLYNSWIECIFCNPLLHGRFCFPVSGVYTVDADNQVQVGILEEDDDNYDEDDVSQNWQFFLQHLPTSPPIKRDDPIVCPESTTNIISQLHQTRNEWLPGVVCLLTMAANGVNGVCLRMVEKGKSCGRPARIAVGALNVTTVTAHASNIVNTVCCLPEKYKKGTLTFEDKVTVLVNVMAFSDFMKHLRKCAVMYREIRKTQKLKGAVKKVITPVRVGSTQVTPVTPSENHINLANLSNNHCSGTL